MGKWTEFLGRGHWFFHSPSWALGSSWPEVLAHRYHRPPGSVQMGVVFLITPSGFRVPLRTCPSSYPFWLSMTF